MLFQNSDVRERDSDVERRGETLVRSTVRGRNLYYTHQPILMIEVHNIIEYVLQISGVVLGGIWVLLIGLSYASGAKQLAALLGVLFLAVVGMWYLDEIRAPE